MIKQFGGIFGRHPTFADVEAGSFVGTADLIVTEAGTSRTLSAADNGKVIYCTNAAATTVTMGVGLPAGFSVTIIQGGTGKVTLASGGLILQSYSGLFSTMGEFAIISVISPETDVFFAAGNLGV
jgi:hypothetical protein